MGFLLWTVWKIRFGACELFAQVSSLLLFDCFAVLDTLPALL
jgi:hypothetical protein